MIVESTLSGKRFARQVEKFREEGYRVKMLFVTPLDPQTSVDRVSLRISKGGHSVPEADIRRRFARAHANFWHLYRPLADQWKIICNKTAGGSKNIVYGDRDSIHVTETDYFDAYLKLCYTISE